MPAPFLLIDGYNLMHAVGLFQRAYGPGEFEKRRNRFLRQLASHLSERERPRTTVVFDGTAGRNRDIDRESFEGMTVLYSAAQTEADDLLEDLIAGHSAPRQILLVSSDHRLQKAARRRRGQFVDSEDFADRLERRAERDSDTDATDSGPSAEKLSGLQPGEELQHWLKEFGEVPGAAPPQPERADPDFDVDALQREIDAESESDEIR
ncbi:MAG: NYN domain-containing protein [Planctomycetaceae bacterium]